MNLLRYQFCEENKPFLLKFVEIAKQNKLNPYCDHIVYNKLSKILSQTDILSKCNEFDEVIIINDSHEDLSNEMDVNSLHLTYNKSVNVFNETVLDLTSAIKEILATEKYLTTSVINDLHKPGLNLETVFKQLQEQLSTEEIVAFGITLQSNVIRKNEIIANYIKYLLIYQLSLEYSEQCQLNLNEFSNKYPDIVSEELCFYLLNQTEGCRMSQLLEALPPDFKTKLLRTFLTDFKELEENHLPIIDILLGDNVETQTINKLVEIMSRSADNYATNKVYGKFLLRLIQLLGKQVATLEKPMNHIVGTHRSIWKAKIHKIYDELMQDSLSMSQSFRY